MKPITITVVIVVAALAALGGWFLGRKSHPAHPANGEREVAFYQSAMHPWIKSDKPGTCTICGMQLTPVFKGEQGLEVDADMITLSPSVINVINVQTELVARRPIERTLEVAGRIEADETRNRVLSAYVDGRIDKLFVNYIGAEVRAGEPLALIYSPSLLSAQREFLTALAQTNLASNPRLASDHERLVEGARQRLKLLGLTDGQIDSIRDSGSPTNITTEITAPISGTVVSRSVVEGQYVREGEKLFEIIDLSQLWFRFDVYEQDLHLIQPGQVVQVTSPAVPGQTFEGPVAFIDPNINEATRSARVRVELQNPVIGERRALYNGLYATGRIQMKSEPVLAISRGAVIDPGDYPRVYIERETGVYEHRAIRMGRRGEGFIEVLEGLDEGDKVVVNGNLLIDSQVQINRVGASSHTHPATPTPAEQHEQHADAPPSEDLTDFFAGLSTLAAALAADDAQTYHSRAAELPLPNDPSLRGLVEKVKSTSAANLDEARAAFLPLSLAASETAMALRKAGRDPKVKVYRCPMYPKMGNNAYWVQAEGPLRNPFYGSEMLECGIEVR